MREIFSFTSTFSSAEQELSLPWWCSVMFLYVVPLCKGIWSIFVVFPSNFHSYKTKNSLMPDYTWYSCLIFLLNRFINLKKKKAFASPFKARPKIFVTTGSSWILTISMIHQIPFVWALVSTICAMFINQLFYIFVLKEIGAL